MEIHTLVEIFGLCVVVAFLILRGIPKLIPYLPNETRTRSDARGALSMVAIGVMIVISLALVTR
jgi:hypothetical protein